MKQKTADNITALIAGAVLFLALLTALEARAFEEQPPANPQKQEQDQKQGQDQSQDQAQDQAQSMDQTQSMGSQENLQVVNFSSPDDVTVRNTASANPPNVSSSHACALGGSLGIGVPGANIGGGKQKVDPECVRREEARLLNALGERELAVIHLCNSPALVESLGTACGPSVTEEELRRRIEFLLNERNKDRERCTEEKGRIYEACFK